MNEGYRLGIYAFQKSMESKIVGLKFLNANNNELKEQERKEID